MLVGIALITYAALNVYQVFGGKMPPAPIFNFEGVKIDASQLTTTPELDTSNLPPEQAQLVQQMIKPKQENQAAEIEILPSDVLNDTSNLIAHVILMGFIAGIGSRFASLGIQMLRPIVVKVREAKQQNG